MTITREPLYEDVPAGRLAALGRHVVAWFASIGQAVRLMAESFGYLPGVFLRRRGRAELMKQFYSTGIRTLPVITVVGLFAGMILGLQVGLALRRFNQEVYLGSASRRAWAARWRPSSAR